MIRFDFDVVSDPVPAKPVAPRPAEVPAARKRGEGDGEPQPAAGASEDGSAGSS
jgi:hypothetical protein